MNDIEMHQSHNEGNSRLLGVEITRNPSNALEAITRIVQQHYPQANLQLLQQAYNRAQYQHRNQRRKSGEPYIIHPLGVAQILADLGLSEDVVAAGLLHDTVEDTDYTLEQCNYEFGLEITALVDGMTKISKIQAGNNAPAETIRKLIISMSHDIRVLLIKLADRTHNARTWRYVKPESARNKAKETLDIYVPLANRLGINAMKTELEELSFKQLHPDIYNKLVVMVARKTGEKDSYIKQLVKQIRFKLSEKKITATVTGRQKNYYSIYQKIVNRQHDFDDIYDLLGIRIIVPTIQDCYLVLGIVHSQWTPVPGRIKDYIAMPKINMYQSIHTTVVDANGHMIEIQIRTWDMHHSAEYGIAAHWKYKATINGEAASPSTALVQPDSTIENNLKWVKHLVKWSNETPSSAEFINVLKDDLQANAIYVFTPKGKVITLGTNSTPIDFAYAIHTMIGNNALGAKVNGHLVPLDTILHDGDTVNILTSPTSLGPSIEWLSFVKSSKARGAIKHWFSHHYSDSNPVADDQQQYALTAHQTDKTVVVPEVMQESHDDHFLLSADDLLLPEATEDQISATVRVEATSCPTYLLTDIRRLISALTVQSDIHLTDTLDQHVITITLPIYETELPQLLQIKQKITSLPEVKKTVIVL